MYKSFSISLPCATTDHFFLSDSWLCRNISFVPILLNVFVSFFVFTGLCSGQAEIFE